MFIELVNLSIECFEDYDKRDLISRLLRTHMKRENLVLSNRESLKMMLLSGCFGHNEKSAVEDILSYFRDYKCLQDMVVIKVLVDFSDRDVHSFEDGVIVAGWGRFNDTLSVSSVRLYLENSSEHELYRTIANYYKSVILHNNGISISFSVVNGGGSSTAPEFEKGKELSPYALAITDSDRSYPDQSVGSTAMAFTSNDRDRITPYHVIVLDVHEAENLVPLSIFLKLVEKHQLCSDIYDSYKSAIEVDDRYAIHFDIKNGLNWKKIARSDRRALEFWKPLFELLYPESDCVVGSECGGCESCPSIPGLGSNVLSNATNVMELSSPRWKFETKGEGLLEGVWVEVGKLLFSWGCGGFVGKVRAT
jgi:hypothetical protein